MLAEYMTILNSEEAEWIRNEVDGHIQRDEQRDCASQNGGLPSLGSNVFNMVTVY
jgi:hypothetical protein